MAVSVGDAEDEAAERTNASMLMPEMAQQLQDLRLLLGTSAAWKLPSSLFFVETSARAVLVVRFVGGVWLSGELFV